jgi:ketosteroid isomerase-like protein
LVALADVLVHGKRRGRHQLDVDATLSDKADEPAKLWDDDAVRLGQDRPADIRDLRIVGEWAFEWGYFDASSKTAANAKPETVHGKQLRILRRQADGSWKFARVMTLIDSRK